jgi:succinyl-diaminopimelate desuccinylase
MSMPAARDCTTQLLAWLTSQEYEMASLLSDLVNIPTENPPGNNYRACADRLEKTLTEAGLSSQRHEFRPSASTSAPIQEPSTALEATFGCGTPALYFHGHYDVVPAQSPDQFHAIRKQHFLFGRGSCDMKGGIVAMLFAIRALQECRIELNGRITLLLVPDEETGGARGSAWLARQGKLGREAVGMLLAEPTSAVIWNANRGAFTLRVKVSGKSAHVGLQHQGENAFEQMVRVVDRLQQLKREVEHRQTACAIGSEQRRNSILMLGGESGGGTNFNIVPDHCWFTVDRRINPEENLEEEKTRLLAILEDCRREGIRLQWETLQEGHASASSEHDPLAHALSSSIEAVTGDVPRFEMCPGLLETRFYAAQGIPAYAYGPGLLSVAHGPNEYVDLRRVRDCAAIYAQTAIKILN